MGTISTKLKPLIDADILVYEVAFGVQSKEMDGSIFIKSFDHAIEFLDKKIDEIYEETWATESPTFYLSQDYAMIERANRRRINKGLDPLDYQENYRVALAKTKPYKGTRSGQEKPYHYHNIREYIANNFDCKIAVGLEADDLLSIDHRKSYKDYDTIIASRDKDLKITPGLHYTWACNGQPSWGPKEIDELGFLEDVGKGKIFGGGLRFFYAQTLMGDSVDNIPGLPGAGPKLAYNLLKDCESEEELFFKVLGRYEEYYKKKELEGSFREYFLEQANLLWMVQELDEAGQPVFYKMFDER